MVHNPCVAGLDKTTGFDERGVLLVRIDINHGGMFGTAVHAGLDPLLLDEHLLLVLVEVANPHVQKPLTNVDLGLSLDSGEGNPKLPVVTGDHHGEVGGFDLARESGSEPRGCTATQTRSCARSLPCRVRKRKSAAPASQNSE